MKNITILLFASLILFSCTKDEFKLEENDYLIFGIYNGFCMGNCTSLFKIDNLQLLEDNMSTFVPGEELLFKEDPLSDSKYELAYTAFEEIPQELKNHMDKSFGCPGCVDQDIIYLQYFDGADTYEWQVDTDTDALPEFLVPYTKKIVEIVDQLKD